MIRSYRTISSRCLPNMVFYSQTPFRNNQIPMTIFLTQSRQMGFFSKFIESFQSRMAKEKKLQQDLKELSEHEVTGKIKEVGKTVSDTSSAVKTKVQSTAKVVSDDVIKPSVQVAKRVAEPVAEQISKVASETAASVGEKIDQTIDGVKSSKAYQATAQTIENTSKQIEQTRLAKTIVYTATSAKEALEKEKYDREGGAYFDEPPPELRKGLIEDVAVNAEELGIIAYDAPKTGWEKKLDELAASGPIKGVLENKVVSGIFSGVGNAVTGAAKLVDTVGDKIFPQTEGAEVIVKLRYKDPNFQLFPFVNFLRDHVCHKIVQAYLDGDLEYLKKKCGDKAFAVLSAAIKGRETSGLTQDRRILTITQVELLKAFLSEEGTPTICISFVCQQVNAFYNKKGEVAQGSENDIHAVYYVWALQPDEKFADLRWRIAEMAIHGSLKLLS